MLLRARARALTALTIVAPLGVAPAQDEPVCLVQVLDNADFAEPPAAPGGRGPARIPWWAARPESAGPLRDELAGVPGVRTRPGELLWQPIPVYAPLAERLVISGEVGGFGLVTLRDGRGGLLSRAHAAIFGELLRFELTGAELAAELARAPLPRLVLQLAVDPDAQPAAGQAEAFWARLEARVALPCPGEAALRAEILAELHAAVDPWLERALDREGPRQTAFLCRYFDAETGEPLGAPQVPAHPLNPLFADVLLPVLAVPGVDEPAWEQALARYLADFLELGLHPDTGLPCKWDPLRDVPVADATLEISRPLALLLDVAETGPADLRERAAAAALRIGEHVLAHGVFPDGTVAPSYRPADGVPAFDVPPIRRLDLPAQLARLAARTGDARFAEAAYEACLEVELTSYWPGGWDSIDPGFDDSYGHYGARALVIAAALPAHPAGETARRLALSGFARYAPLWRDALRFGGNLAADQVRCWEIALDLAERWPEHRAEVVALLDLAVRAHWKGGQSDGGAWIDVTSVGFTPRRLPVGDTGGVPQNLLVGLGLVYARCPELRGDELRARYTAVMRTTLAAFRAPHGLVGDARRPARGQAAVGSPRFAIGLAAMLEGLAPR